MAGLYFEQLEAGQEIPHLVRRTVPETDMLFCALTHYPAAALHLNAEYMRHTPYGAQRCLHPGADGGAVRV